MKCQVDFWMQLKALGVVALAMVIGGVFGWYVRSKWPPGGFHWARIVMPKRGGRRG